MNENSWYNLAVIRRTFDWKWVFVGAVLIVLGNVLAYVLLWDKVEHLVVGEQRVLTGAGLAAAMALVIYFLGGLVVGRMSSGRTVMEPAVAAVLGLVVIVVLQFMLGMFNIVGLVLGAPFCFGVAYLGGRVGAKWHAHSQD